VVGFVRYVKSEEEIECLRRAVKISEAAIDEMIEVARPGVDEAVVYGRVTGKLMELGSEHYSRARTDWTAHGFAWKTGPIDGHLIRFTDPPVGRRLQPGTFITNEVSAIWGAMVSQEVQPILIGPIPDHWRELIQVQRGLWEAGLEMLKPGTPFVELANFGAQFSNDPRIKTSITLHGRGVGDDGPLITGRSDNSKLGDLQLDERTCWVWKPAARTADGRSEFQWGGTVVVRESGAECLFTRPHALISIV
jgi:Xaa-Pro aminopeptidase